MAVTLGCWWDPGLGTLLPFSIRSANLRMLTSSRRCRFAYVQMSTPSLLLCNNFQVYMPTTSFHFSFSPFPAIAPDWELSLLLKSASVVKQSSLPPWTDSVSHVFFASSSSPSLPSSVAPALPHVAIGHSTPSAPPNALHLAKVRSRLHYLT